MFTLENNHAAAIGLAHLVEAATALATLQEPPQHSSPEQPASEVAAMVSDDDVDAIKLSVKSKDIFPLRLMEVLSDRSVSDVISWLPHGLSFVIIKPDDLAERVLCKYFADPRSSTKYSSFTRKLNRWGFRQAMRGPDTGAFHHPLFRRDQPELCLDMRCQKSRKGMNTTSKISEEHKNSNDESTSSNLPPKKRKILSSSPITTTADFTQGLESRSRVVSTSSLSVDSGDGNYISSKKSSTPPPSTTTTIVPYVLPLLTSTAMKASVVVHDSNLVVATLKAGEEQERLRVAKSILFDSYMKALSGQ